MSRLAITDHRTAARGWRVAGMGVGSAVGRTADGGFGLVVVDQGNPRPSCGIASPALAIAS